jgi:hypothetical protein
LDADPVQSSRRADFPRPAAFFDALTLLPAFLRLGNPAEYAGEARAARYGINE